MLSQEISPRCVCCLACPDCHHHDDWYDVGEFEPIISPYALRQCESVHQCLPAWTLPRTWIRCCHVSTAMAGRAMGN